MLVDIIYYLLKGMIYHLLKNIGQAIKKNARVTKKLKESRK